jgi:hypothetical protein
MLESTRQLATLLLDRAEELLGEWPAHATDAHDLICSASDVLAEDNAYTALYEARGARVDVKSFRSLLED